NHVDELAVGVGGGLKGGEGEPEAGGASVMVGVESAEGVGVGEVEFGLFAGGNGGFLGGDERALLFFDLELGVLGLSGGDGFGLGGGIGAGFLGLEVCQRL